MVISPASQREALDLSPNQVKAINRALIAFWTDQRGPAAEHLRSPDWPI
jgi:hypothetical protein